MMCVRTTMDVKGGLIFFKTCKKYMSHIQDSVFEGELSNVQLTKMQKELEPYIDETQDSVIIFKSRQQRWLDKRILG